MIILTASGFQIKSFFSGWEKTETLPKGKKFVVTVCDGKIKEILKKGEVLSVNHNFQQPSVEKLPSKNLHPILKQQLRSGYFHPSTDNNALS